ncbi:MAG: NAD(+)/NADH kinase [Sulfurovum sp.]|nr:NAD(+)/NADH kinase [Sulfurovum sp.]
MSNHASLEMNTAGFILKPNDPDIGILYERIKAQFESKGIKVLLAKRSAELIDVEGIDFEQMCEDADFLVSLGGDGTLLSLVRRSHGYDKPVVGINAGNLGFLADVTIDDVEVFLEQLISKEYRIDERMMIEGYVQRKGGKKESFFAFNDVVLTRPVVSKMATIYASIDGVRFNTYRGDGLIIATPTGSTAYNLASGGPVMYPLTQALIMTPILAHSLTQRPLVVPADFTIELSSPEERIIAVIDGQDNYEMTSDDILVIMGAKRGAKLLHRKERNYFAVLRDKLSWGDAH